MKRGWERGERDLRYFQWDEGVGGVPHAEVIPGGSEVLVDPS